MNKSHFSAMVPRYTSKLSYTTKYVCGVPFVPLSTGAFAIQPKLSKRVGDSIGVQFIPLVVFTIPTGSDCNILNLGLECCI